MPDEDSSLSPFTGWTRDHWERAADVLLEGVVPHTSPGGARILPPGGRRSMFGTNIEGLEGFARTFMLAAFRLRGADGGVSGLADRYARGLKAGCSPASDERWPRLHPRSQAMVEASSIALALHESAPWLWDQLDDADKGHIVDWLSTFLGKETYDNNWLWFRVIVNTFLKSVGAEYEPVDRFLTRIEDFYRGEGWYSDGPGDTYDHYVGWAFHFYALMWARMDGMRSDPERSAMYSARAGEFLRQYQHLFGGEGAPLYQGRSLIYRFAATAPFWAAALLDASPLEPGRTRRLASGALRYFFERGAIANGVLTMGWHGEFLPMAQPYSGSASPYWASKAFVGLLLPKDHSVWTEVERPLPVEEDDFCLALRSPGFLVHGTKEDGIVRIASHRGQRRAVTSHSRTQPRHRRLRMRLRRRFGGADVDEPWADVHYRKLAYSTHTAPDLGAVAEADDLDSQVAVVTAPRVSHRNQIETIHIGDRIAASRWVDGSQINPSEIEVVTIAEAGIELRICRVRATRRFTVRDGGYAIASTRPLETECAPVWAIADAEDGLHSLILGLHGFSEAAVSLREGDNPMGRHSATPYLMSTEFDVEAVTISALWLSRRPRGVADVHHAIRDLRVDGKQVWVSFRDGEHYVVNLEGPSNLEIELGGRRLSGPLRFARSGPEDVYIAQN